MIQRFCDIVNPVSLRNESLFDTFRISEKKRFGELSNIFTFRKLFLPHFPFFPAALCSARATATARRAQRSCKSLGRAATARTDGLATLCRFCSDSGTIFGILFSELILICFDFSVEKNCWPRQTCLSLHKNMSVLVNNFFQLRNQNKLKSVLKKDFQK